MEIKRYINTNFEEVLLKKENIFLGFSIGNKYFLNRENIEKYLRWALENTREKVLILIVDEIQITNLNVRNNSSENYNLNYILRKSLELRKVLDELILIFSRDDREKIKIIDWKEFKYSDKNCFETSYIVYKEFKNNEKFANEVLKSVRNSISDRDFSEEEYNILCDYVLDEFSLAYSGVFYDGNYYGMYIYPYSDSVLDFIEKIQKNEIFQDLHEKLPKEIVKVLILN